MTFDEQHAQIDGDPLVELRRRMQLWASCPDTQGQPLDPPAAVVPLKTIADAVLLLQREIDWQKMALDLWRLLDDIDTLDDACKDDDAAFRAAAYNVQQKRHAILNGSEWELRMEQYEPTDHS